MTTYTSDALRALAHAAPYGTVLSFVRRIDGATIHTPDAVSLPEGAQAFSKPGDARVLALMATDADTALDALRAQRWLADLAPAAPAPQPAPALPTPQTVATGPAAPQATDETAPHTPKGILVRVDPPTAARTPWAISHAIALALRDALHAGRAITFESALFSYTTFLCKDGHVLALQDGHTLWSLPFRPERNPHNGLCHDLCDHARRASAYFELVLQAAHGTHPFRVRMIPDGVALDHQGAEAATFVLKKERDTTGWKVRSWRSLIRGKPWTGKVSYADDMVKATLKRLAPPTPLFAVRDPATGTWLGGWTQEGDAVFEARFTKAKRWKRLADAQGHVLRIEGAYHHDAPTAPGWEDAVDTMYAEWADMSHAKGFSVPVEIVGVDPEDTTHVWIERDHATLQRMLAAKRLRNQRVIAPYGGPAAAALDAAADHPGRTTLVAVFDPAKAHVRWDAKAALKRLGIPTNRITLRSTKLEDEGMVWSALMEPQDAALFFDEVPSHLAKVSLRVADILA